jgi:hypothetical protein
MSIEITHVRFSGFQKTHEAITHYKWSSREGSGGESIDKPALVAWIDNKGIAYVGSGAQQVRVGSVHPNSSPAYVRTYADKQWSNNLLSLPTF